MAPRDRWWGGGGCGLSSWGGALLAGVGVGFLKVQNLLVQVAGVLLMRAECVGSGCGMCGEWGVWDRTRVCGLVCVESGYRVCWRRQRQRWDGCGGGGSVVGLCVEDAGMAACLLLGQGN